MTMLRCIEGLVEPSDVPATARPEVQTQPDRGTAEIQQAGGDSKIDPLGALITAVEKFAPFAQDWEDLAQAINAAYESLSDDQILDFEKKLLAMQYVAGKLGPEIFQAVRKHGSSTQARLLDALRVDVALGAIKSICPLLSRIAQVDCTNILAIEDDVTEIISVLPKTQRAETMSYWEDAREQSEQKKDELGESGPINVSGCAYRMDRQVGKRTISEPVSSFILRPKASATLSGELVFVVDALSRGPHGGPVLLKRDLVIPASAWTTSSSFISAIANVRGAAWYGDNHAVQHVKDILMHRGVPQVAITRGVGLTMNLNNAPRWALPDGTVLGPGGRIRHDTIYSPHPGSVFPDRIRQDRPTKDVAQIAQAVLPNLMELNQPEVMLPNIGFFCAAAMKPQVVKLRGSFPIHSLIGSKGSGKTTLVQRVFLPFAGYTQADVFTVHQTDFALLRLLSDTASVPIVLDEYRPGQMEYNRKQFLHSAMRSLYSNSSFERGTANRGLVSYTLTAPLCLAGEGVPDDPALCERLILVLMNPNTVKEKNFADAMEQIDPELLVQLSRPYAEFVVDHAGEAEEMIQTAEQSMTILLQHIGQGHLPPRIRANLAVIQLGVMLFQRFAAHLGVKLPDLEQYMEPAVKHVLQGLFDGSKSPKDQLDKFIESLATMAQIDSGKSGEIEATKVLLPKGCHKVESGRLFFHPPSCYDAYLAHRGHTRQDDETQGLPALRKAIRENHERHGYITDYDVPKCLAGKTQRVAVVDLNLAQHLDIGGFLDDTKSPPGTAKGNYNCLDEPGTKKPTDPPNTYGSKATAEPEAKADDAGPSRVVGECEERGKS